MKTDIKTRNQEFESTELPSHSLGGKIPHKGEPADQFQQYNFGLLLGEIVSIPLRLINYRRGEVDEDRGSFRLLVRSIDKADLLQPVILQKKGDRFEVVAGNRRVAACRRLDRKDILARILNGDIPGSEMFKIRLMENLARENAGPLELAKAVHDLLKAMHPNLELNEMINMFINADVRPEKSRGNAVTVTTVKEITGRSSSTIRNWLSLLKLPQDQNIQIKDKLLNISQAYILASHIDHQDFAKIAEKALNEKLNKAELIELFQNSDSSTTFLKTCLNSLERIEQRILKNGRISKEGSEKILNRLSFMIEIIQKKAPIN